MQNALTFGIVGVIVLSILLPFLGSFRFWTGVAAHFALHYTVLELNLPWQVLSLGHNTWTS